MALPSGQAVRVLGDSDQHRKVLELVASAAETNAEVLILGPSGVGKELYARMIHEQGPRAARPFVAVNCGAVPVELFENELFGHVGGAFTGARPRAAGLVAQAEGGTLFLDEIDTLHPVNQVKLLRLIQEKEYRPLGEARARRVDVRFVAASNTDLFEASQCGRFRLDLFFRLRVLPVQIPPLRERPADVLVLLQHFVDRYAAEYGKAPVTFSPSALLRLTAYAWPGNVRELENCVRFLICVRPGQRIEPEALPLLEAHAPGEPGQPPRPPAALTETSTLQEAKRRLIDDFERSYIRTVLDENDGNIAAAARAAGKHRRAFFELMRRYGIRPGERSAPAAPGERADDTVRTREPGPAVAQVDQPVVANPARGAGA